MANRRFRSTRAGYHGSRATHSGGSTSSIPTQRRASLWVHTLDQFRANGIQHPATILCRSMRIRCSPLFQQGRNENDTGLHRRNRPAEIEYPVSSPSRPCSTRCEKSAAGLRGSIPATSAIGTDAGSHHRPVLWPSIPDEQSRFRAFTVGSIGTVARDGVAFSRRR